MKHPEELCAEIIGDIKTDVFAFYYGRPPDQNFDVEAQSLPAVFLDTPIISKDKTTSTNLRYADTPLRLFFAYKMDIDSTAPQNLVNKKKAWDSAREFILRCRQRDDIWNVEAEQRTDVDRVFDVCLGGCLLEVTLKIIDNTSTCLT